MAFASSMSKGDAAMTDKEVSDIKRRKNACERCRRSKVRCHLDTYDACGKCRRCFDSDKECLFIALPPRKPRKRTDARVTTLEKELAAVKSLFSRVQRHDTSDSQHDKSSTSSSNCPSPKAGDFNSRSSRSPTDSCGIPEPTLEIITGYLDSSMLTERDARKLFSDFTNVLVPEYPMVVLSSGDTFDIVREQSPMLLLAAIAAASGSQSGILFAALHSHASRLLFERVIMKGERCIELLQAILILEIWFCPPDDLRNLNFYQYIHIAATMAMELGLVGVSQAEISSKSLAESRLGLAVYFACSSAAISVRRQRILQITQSVRNLVGTLRSSSDLLDRRLAAWMDLQLITEDAFELSKNKASTIFLLHDQVSALHERLSLWRASLSEEVINDALLVHFWYAKTKLHESALHVESSPEELIPPYLPAGLSTSTGGAQLSPSYVRDARGFIEGCQGTLETILSVSAPRLRRYPTVVFARGAHAIKGLQMIESLLQKPESKLGCAIDKADIQYAKYWDALQQHLQAVSGENKCKVPVMVLSLARILSPSHAAVHGKEKCGFEKEEGIWSNTTNGLESSEDITSVPAETPYDSVLFGMEAEQEYAFPDIDFFQMPDIGGFTFPVMDDLANEQVQADYWNLGDPFAPIADWTA